MENLPFLKEKVCRKDLDGIFLASAKAYVCYKIFGKEFYNIHAILMQMIEASMVAEYLGVPANIPFWQFKENWLLWSKTHMAIIESKITNSGAEDFLEQSLEKEGNIEEGEKSYMLLLLSVLKNNSY